MSEPILYSYWHSSCAWRVRIALGLKKIKYQQVHKDLVKDEQCEQKYLDLNPAGYVPVFIHNDHVIPESLAILEYIDEVYPQEPKLIYGDAAQKALIRSLALVIITNIQPFQNFRVTSKHSDDPVKQHDFTKFFIERGFETLEKRLQKTAGKFAVGDQLSLADVCIPPQVHWAGRRYLAAPRR
uniref:maleylacetoacetate isomerase n=1 Tax=Bursaphelenchus xylophilus TaxID=6326 RepID=A0A1I7SFI7_BURXY